MERHSRQRLLPPALLADATWWGTLAAARDLGSRGVPVVLASDALLAPARWSRHVRRTVSCPPSKDARGFVEWLLAFGAREPGHVLYPTSDETAWYLAAHREVLSGRYLLYSPPIDALVRILDKASLARDGAAAGLEVPETWCPEDETDLRRIARRAAFPLYIKPRAQVLLVDGRSKGVRVDSAAALEGTWLAWRNRLRYEDVVRAHIPGVERPILQACHAGSERIYTVDGFIDESGEMYATQACLKLLQRPRLSGHGIIFEDAPMDAVVSQGLRRLCRAVGYHGIFDAEFIEHDGRKLLIDFNPRFYNHMAFEVDRGLPLPWMAYLAAARDREALRAAVAEACVAPKRSRAYVHHLATHLLLRMQGLSGGMTRDERRRWAEWIAQQHAEKTDPSLRRDDPAPAAAELAMEVVGFLRHPRSYLRGLVSRRS